MNNLVGVVNKPQFDVNVFEVGKAVHVKKVGGNGYVLFNKHCIITETNPLYLGVHYYSEIEHELTDMRIDVNDVVSGGCTINLMKEDVKHE